MSSGENFYSPRDLVKVIPQQAKVAQGVPGRLRPQIFLTFGTTRVVGCQPYTSTAFTPGEIPGTHFQGLSKTWFRRGDPRKKSPVTPPGIDHGTVRLVAKCLNHYATPGPQQCGTKGYYCIYLRSEHLLNENCDLCEEMTSTG